MTVLLTSAAANNLADVLQEAKVWLAKAIKLAVEAGPQATDIETAEYKLELGNICWQLGIDSQVIFPHLKHVCTSSLLRIYY